MLIEAYCDGAARGQGVSHLGEAAAATVILRNKKEVSKMARGLGPRTNNEAEYEAVILALIICAAAELRDPIVYSDSTLVVNQITGRWECRSDLLLPYLYTVRDIGDSFRFRIQHVPRRHVAAADALANDFLDTLPSQKSRRKSRKKTNFVQTILQVVDINADAALVVIPSWNPHEIIGVPIKEFPTEIRQETHVIAWANLAAVHPDELRLCRFEPIG